MTEAKVWAVVPAAGKGARMGATTPKQYLQLAGKSVLQHTLELLLRHPRITATALVISADDKLWSSHAHAFGDDLYLAIGGSERCHSVLAGIDALSEIGGESDWVLVHDAARPCLRASDIDHMLTELGDSRWGGILASPVRDTLKRCSDTGEIESTVDRTRLWHALTPQMFRLGTLRDALSRALNGGLIVTDEAQAIEAAGGTPRIVEGHADNIKITHPADLKLAEIYLKIQGRY